MAWITSSESRSRRPHGVVAVDLVSVRWPRVEPVVAGGMTLRSIYCSCLTEPRPVNQFCPDALPTVQMPLLRRFRL
jgi:hypothetical protein